MFHLSQTGNDHTKDSLHVRIKKDGGDGPSPELKPLATQQQKYLKSEEP